MARTRSRACQETVRWGSNLVALLGVSGLSGLNHPFFSKHSQDCFIGQFLICTLGNFPGTVSKCLCNQALSRKISSLPLPIEILQGLSQLCYQRGRQRSRGRSKASASSWHRRQSFPGSSFRGFANCTLLT